MRITRRVILFFIYSFICLFRIYYPAFIDDLLFRLGKMVL
ncbi:hypothetical protein DDI_2828 [Dickeya dianthicola RNS04.9]|nr:hypothetical protein DDI_2828 [Dickeya dianthicola RNS04.9]